MPDEPEPEPLNPDYEATALEPSEAAAQEIWNEFDAAASKSTADNGAQVGAGDKDLAEADPAANGAPAGAAEDPEAAGEAQREANVAQAEKAADDDKAAGEGKSSQAAKNNGAATGAVDDDKPADGTKPNAKAGDAAPAKTPKADDIWTSASPEQTAAFKAAEARATKAEQSFRSREGRLKAQQRQIDDLNNPAKPAPGAHLGAVGKPVSHETGKPAAAGDDTTADGFLGSEEWSSFKEEYPEVAGPLGNVVAALENKVTTLEKTQTAVGEDRLKVALDEQRDLLDTSFPEWTKLLDDDPAMFKAWVDEQPRHIREATQRNAAAIVDAEEAADVFGRYHAYREGTTGTGEGQAAADPSPGDTPDTGSNKAPDKKLSARRQRQLESADSPAGNGPGVTSAPPADGQQAWDYFDALHRKKSQQQSDRAF